MCAVIVIWFAYHFPGIASRLAAGAYKNVVVVMGAGVSTAAGIPDFRTPGTGLYDNLQKYDLPTPQSVFSLDFFRERPQPFCTLAKELWPEVGRFNPTYSHRFLALLERKGVLRRIYTQNIDGLEALAGNLADKIVQCHGGFDTCHCIEKECRRQVSVRTVCMKLVV
jgi:NAD-dependent deacetylase sirtuin 2